MAPRGFPTDDRLPPSRGADDDATNAGPPVTIEVVEGPNKGQKLPVKGGRMVVGRGDGCDLKLDDASTSRRHLEFIVGFHGVRVRDLGSSTGTRVKGDKVDEAPLAHRDEVQLGTTVLRVIDELKRLEERRKPPEPVAPAEEPAGDEYGQTDAGEAPPPRAPSRRSVVAALPEGRHGTHAIAALPTTGRKIPPFAFGSAAAGGLFIIGLVVVGLRPSDKPSEKPQAVEARRAQLATLAAKGRQALSAKDFEGANEVWVQLRAQDPNFNELKELEEFTALQLQGRDLLRDGRKAIDSGDFAAARQALKAVPERSDYVEEAKKLIPSLDEQEALALEAQAAAALDARDMDLAHDLQVRIGRLSPSRGEALSQRIAAVQAAMLKEEQQGRVQAGVRREQEKKRKADAEEAAIRAECEPGLRKFLAGEYERAASEYGRVAEATRSPEVKLRARKLGDLTRKFLIANNELKALEAEGNVEATVGALDRAMGAIEQIAPDSPMAKQLRGKLGKALLSKGKSAQARQDYALAARAYRQVLSMEPGNAAATDGLRGISQRAGDVYLQAYEEEHRDKEAARKLYKAVQSMVGSDNPYFSKAQKRIEALEGQPP